MSLSIKSINLKDTRTIDYRSVFVQNGRKIRSVNIHQTNGSFVTTEPLENGGQIVVYPQSPNNPRKTIQTLKSFLGYGDIDMPLDARFNYIKDSIFIADSGNSSVLKVNAKDHSLISSAGEMALPHAIVPEINKNGFFVKAFSDIHNGAIHYYGFNGQLIDTWTFPCELGMPSLNIEGTAESINALPLTHSMVYDYARSRLWWTSGSVVYMADLKTQQIIDNNLYPEYIDTRSVDIEFSTGNAFVVVQTPHKGWEILQVFRDNNENICSSYILDPEVF